MLLIRPVLVQDCCSAEGITHDYDTAVRREGGAASFAVPIQYPPGRGACSWADCSTRAIGPELVCW
ncbi:hypothetical protein [Streptomyces sp. 900105755]